jgi:parvulin-like peptidyl-prolyl isomerase
MVPEFDEVVFNLEPGERSGVFRTVFGYHIARLLDRRPEGVADFQEVKNRIAAVLHEQKKQEFLGKYLDGLRASAKVEFMR